MRGTDIGADRLTVTADCFRGWHAHPAPVFVTRAASSGITVQTPSALGHPYSVAQSFIEDAYAVHNVTSAGGAEFLAIVIKPEGFAGPAFQLNRDKPNNCNF